MTTQEATDLELIRHLDFEPEIPCESTFEGHDHDAEFIMQCSCGCAPALCKALITRALILEEEHAGYCPSHPYEETTITAITPIKEAK